MAQNLKLDPQKKDYIFANGSPIASDSVLEAAYYAIKIPQNKYLYGQEGQGSLLYTLKGKRDSSIEQQFASYAKAAIDKQLIETGQAKAVSITNIETTRYGTSNEIDIVPSEVQISNELNFVSVE